MKLEEGMYVRYARGMINGCVPIRIARIVDCSDDVLIKIDNGQCILRDDVIKASHNLIDLIELGDYVNKKPIEEITSSGDYKAVCINYFYRNQRRKLYLENKEIESVVTKEQFESAKYEVKKDE